MYAYDPLDGCFTGQPVVGPVFSESRTSVAPLRPSLLDSSFATQRTGSYVPLSFCGMLGTQPLAMLPGTEGGNDHDQAAAQLAEAQSALNLYFHQQQFRVAHPAPATQETVGAGLVQHNEVPQLQFAAGAGLILSYSPAPLQVFPSTGASLDGARTVQTLLPAPPGLVPHDASAQPQPYGLSGAPAEGAGGFVYASEAQEQAAAPATALWPPPSLQRTPPPEHETSQAKRRGPMDEMRQLLRILVKILPQSLSRLPAGQEAGGGNRVTEQQIKSYLDAVLGEEAPRPNWGVRNGWGTYLAELLSWAVGREITSDQARNCVFRAQGRAWQIKEQELASLGIYAYSWPLPLTQPAVREANDNPGPPPQDTHYLPPLPGWPETAGVLPPISRSKQRASSAHTPPAGAAAPGPKLALPAPGSPVVAPTQPEPPRPRVQEPPEHTTTSSQPLCPIPSRSTGVHPALAETRQGAQSELGLLQGALEKIQQAAFLRIQNCMTPPSEEMQMVCMNIYTLITKQYLNDSDMPQPSGPGGAGGAQAAAAPHRQPIAPVVTRLGSPGKLPGSLKRSGSLPTSPAQVVQTGRQPLAASKLSRAPAAAPGPMLLDQLADVAAQHERQADDETQLPQAVLQDTGAAHAAKRQRVMDTEVHNSDVRMVVCLAKPGTREVATFGQQAVSVLGQDQQSHMGRGAMVVPAARLPPVTHPLSRW